MKGIEIRTITGKVKEIFQSIQGEGLYCGQKQTFVRTYGCNLYCSYCDTPNALQNDTYLNMTALQVAQKCAEIGVRNVSLTGGEPLLQSEFLAQVIVILREASESGNPIGESGCVVPGSLRFHLETNGTLPVHMKNMAHLVDVVAMDIKLPSATGLSSLWEKHAEFLDACITDRVFVKMVVASESTDDEIEIASRLVAGVSKQIPMILQPLSGSNQPSGDMLMRFQDTALCFLTDVRVVPQCHKMLGVR